MRSRPLCSSVRRRCATTCRSSSRRSTRRRGPRPSCAPATRASADSPAGGWRYAPAMAISPLGPPRRTPEPTLYDAVGGEEFFTQLVDHFYDNVEADPALLAVYPDPDDLGPARERFRLFLCQYWGGPTTYSDQRGHPRLRMRHAPFAVTTTARDHWLHHFRAALDQADLTPAQDQQFWEYVTHAAQFMVNTLDDPDPAAGRTRLG